MRSTMRRLLFLAMFLVFLDMCRRVNDGGTILMRQAIFLRKCGSDRKSANRQRQTGEECTAASLLLDPE